MTTMKSKVLVMVKARNLICKVVATAKMAKVRVRIPT